MTAVPSDARKRPDMHAPLAVWEYAFALESALDASRAQLAEIEADVEVCGKHAGDVLIGDRCGICDAEARLARINAECDRMADELGHAENVIEAARDIMDMEPVCSPEMSDNEWVVALRESLAAYDEARRDG